VLHGTSDRWRITERVQSKEKCGERQMKWNEYKELYGVTKPPVGTRITLKCYGNNRIVPKYCDGAKATVVRHNKTKVVVGNVPTRDGRKLTIIPDRHIYSVDIHDDLTPGWTTEEAYGWAKDYLPVNVPEKYETCNINAWLLARLREGIRIWEEREKEGV